MSLLYIFDFYDCDKALWENILHQNNKSKVPIEIWPNVKNPDAVEFIMIVGNPNIDYGQYKNLKVIHSMAAGVEHILQNPTLSPNIKVTRTIDKEMQQVMSEYVAMAIISHHRHYFGYEAQRQKKIWEKIDEASIDEISVGIMGFGSFGLDVAKRMRALGYKTIGWSKSAKPHLDFELYTGMQQLSSFLSRSNYLVCLLPHTAQTTDILNKQTMIQLPKNAYVINVARGGVLVEEDLLELINNGHLSGACLDVCKTEPLPKNHLFWRHPKIFLTPHIASNPIPQNAITQGFENYDRLQKNFFLLNEISRQAEY